MQYVARRTTAEAFAPLVYALAHHNGLLRAQPLVVLGDGAKWIWNLAQEQFPEAIQIVDEYHAREHVWDVARAAFAAEPEVRDSWAQVVIDQLSAGQVEQVIAAIEKLPPLAREPGKARSLLETEADYFRRNIHRMRYPVFRATSVCLWGVGSQKRRVKQSSQRGPNVLGCAGLQMASMPFSLCAPPPLTRSSINAGKLPERWLDDLQLFPTPETLR